MYDQFCFEFGKAVAGVYLLIEKVLNSSSANQQNQDKNTHTFHNFILFYSI